MMNMSKILDSDSSSSCLPWQAPQFEQSAVGGNRLRTSRQQNQIEQDAFEQGFNQGYDEGMKQAQKDASENLNYLQSLITALAKVSTTLLTDLASVVLDLADQIIIWDSASYMWVSSFISLFFS